MKTRTIEEITGTERHIQGVGFESLRLILAGDNMGFSVHKTVIPKGGPYHWHYKHHLEACYCIKGGGVLTDLNTFEEMYVQPETIYILDQNDDHTFEATSDTILISIFNPPVIGNEVHDNNGSYEDGGYFDAMAQDILNVIDMSTNDYDARESIKNILKLKSYERV